MGGRWMKRDCRGLVEWLRHRNSEVFKYLPLVTLSTTNAKRNGFVNRHSLWQSPDILLACLLFWNWLLVTQTVPGLECAEDRSCTLHYM